MCVFAFQFGRPLSPACDCTRDAQPHNILSRVVGQHDKHQLDSLSATAARAIKRIDYGEYRALYVRASRIFQSRVDVVENITGIQLICPVSRTDTVSDR